MSLYSVSMKFSIAVDCPAMVLVMKVSAKVLKVLKRAIEVRG